MEKKPNTSTDNYNAVKELSDRIHISCERKETAQLKFVVDISSGKIVKLEWDTENEINFDNFS